MWLTCLLAAALAFSLPLQQSLVVLIKGVLDDHDDDGDGGKHDDDEYNQDVFIYRGSVRKRESRIGSAPQSTVRLSQVFLMIFILLIIDDDPNHNYYGDRSWWLWWHRWIWGTRDRQPRQCFEQNYSVICPLLNYYYLPFPLHYDNHIIHTNMNSNSMMPL